jgi:hypothetical protein
MQFGRVDRPSVYRALGHLERDGLVRVHSEGAGSRERRVFSLTPIGERVLATWMRAIREERDVLDEVLRRYQATGRTDGLPAVAGGWAPLLATTWPPGPVAGPASPGAGMPSRPAAAPVSRTSRARPPSGDGTRRGGRICFDGARGRGPAAGDGAAAAGEPVNFALVPERSVLLVEARSSVGPISFGVMGITGWVRAGLRGARLDLDAAPAAHLEIAVDQLRSGNRFYDAELLRRIEARRFPVATLDLRECAAIGDEEVALEGDLTFHGTTRRVEGSVTVSVRPDSALVIRGEQVFDIRDFGIDSPTVLMLRIFPDVRARLHVEAEAG